MTQCALGSIPGLIYKLIIRNGLALCVYKDVQAIEFCKNLDFLYFVRKLFKGIYFLNLLDMT